MSCVGLVNRRLRLAARALMTLRLGMLLVAGLAAVLTAALHVTGVIGHVALGQGGLHALARIDYRWANQSKRRARCWCWR